MPIEEESNQTERRLKRWLENLWKCPACKTQSQPDCQTLLERPFGGKILNGLISGLKVTHSCSTSERKQVFTLVELRKHLLTDCKAFQVTCPCQDEPMSPAQL